MLPAKIHTLTVGLCKGWQIAVLHCRTTTFLPHIEDDRHVKLFQKLGEKNKNKTKKQQQLSSQNNQQIKHKPKTHNHLNMFQFSAVKQTPCSNSNTFIDPTRELGYYYIQKIREIYLKKCKERLPLFWQAKWKKVSMTASCCCPISVSTAFNSFFGTRPEQRDQEDKERDKAESVDRKSVV